MGWLIALAVIVAVLWIPLGVTASYEESGAVVKLVLGFLRFQLYPGKPKEKKEEPKKEQKPAPGKPAAPKEEKKGGSVSDFFPLVDVVLDFLSDIRRKLRVDLLEIRFCMAGGDPADLGIQYGRTVAAVSALDPQLERLFVIKKKHIRVECDFNGEKSQVWANVRLTITVGRILSMGLRHGTKALREYMKIMKLRKGGATK